MSARDHRHLRTVRLRPCGHGTKPCFTLTTWDTGRTMPLGHSVIGYRLSCAGVTVFSGEDFGCAGHVPIDSDKCLASLMSFLTLRPGDTDYDYFAGYSREQLEFAQSFGEEMAIYCAERFGEP